LSANEVNLDFGRRGRIGFDEAVLCQGKSIDQLTVILNHARDRRQPFLLTRLDYYAFVALPEEHRLALDYDPVSRTGFYSRCDTPLTSPQVAVVTAGTADVPIAREAMRTLNYFGHGCTQICDVGVAGLGRLLDRLDDVRRMPVSIVVAGMDGALPSVIGGLVPSVIIAVPTSVGYGVTHGGQTALHAALASCAPGLLVVNIDNGYGAACAALRVLGAMSGAQERTTYGESVGAKRALATRA
jgi:pyridinium-3,5-biscarboxylic acid mononucleotide synthase